MRVQIKILFFFLISLSSFAFHYRVFNKELISIHAWRQCETQSTILNFAFEDNNILHPKRNDRGAGEGLHRKEFPLMQWIFAQFYKLFGNHLIITRILSFLISLISILALYLFIKETCRNDLVSWLTAWAFTFSPSFFYHSINPMPDNLALCLGIFGLFFSMRWIHSKRNNLLIIAAIFLGLSTLVKLPYILYYILPFLLIAFEKIRIYFKLKNLFILGLSVTPAALWYINVIPGWQGNGIVQGVINNQKSLATLISYLLFHLYSTLPELLLNYAVFIIFIIGIVTVFRKQLYKKSVGKIFISLWMFIVLYVVFEINMIEKAHDYYLHPFYPLIYILVAIGIKTLLQSDRKFGKIILTILLILAPAANYVRTQVRWNENSPGFNHSLLEYKEELRKAAPDSSLCIAGNDISHHIFFYYINKKGWGFDHDSLSSSRMDNMIRHGAEYLYSSSRTIEQDSSINKYFDKIILQAGQIYVYKLKN